MLCQAVYIISKQSVNSNWSYSLEVPNSGQNWRFFFHVTLEFDKWPWETKGHLFYATSSFVHHHFVVIDEFKLDRPIDSRPLTELAVGREKLEVVPSFCCLRDCLSSGGGCKLASITRCCVAWGHIQWVPACPHLPLISHHLQRKSLQFVHQERHAPCKQNLSPVLSWFASPAMQ